MFIIIRLKTMAMTGNPTLTLKTPGLILTQLAHADSLWERMEKYDLTQTTPCTPHYIIASQSSVPAFTMFVKSECTATLANTVKTCNYLQLLKGWVAIPTEKLKKKSSLKKLFKFCFIY